MRVIITSGPAYAPIDQVRRITNFATGELGSILSTAFAAAGAEVVCLRGSGSTFPAPAAPVRVETFSTNEEVEEILRDEAGRGPVDAVFHTAALSDFRVRDIHLAPEKGEVDEAHEHEDDECHDDHAETEWQRMAKIPSRIREMHLVLVPARKVLPKLRAMFGPETRLFGWKYELDGTREDALAKAYAQIAACGTNACIINGRAYGDGFGCVFPFTDHRLPHLQDKTALIDFLVRWIAPRFAGTSGPEARDGGYCDAPPNP